LPGGGLNEKESPWNGVIREVKEETGLDVEVCELLGVYSKAEKNELVFSFFCKVVGGELTINDEADGLEYFTVKGIPKNTPPKQVERIKDAFGKENKPIMKVQAGSSSIELIKQGKL